MDAETQKRISELTQSVRDLQLQLERRLSIGGGIVSGQLHVGGWVQLEEIVAEPDAGTGARIFLIDVGGTLTVKAKFPNGSTVDVAQET